MEPDSASVDPKLARLVSLVYFVQGALGIAGIAFPLLLRSQGWDIPKITAFSSWTSLPWTLKIFYGAASDRFPLGGLRRKPYLVLSSFLSTLSWIGLAVLPPAEALLYGFTFINNLGFAATDVVTDALIVERATSENVARYQGLAWGWRSGGAILGGILGGWLAGHFSHVTIFFLASLLPVLTLAAGFQIQENRQSELTQNGNFILFILKGIKEIFCGDTGWFCLLLVSASASSIFNTPLFFYLKENLAFSETFLGSLASLGWMGAIGGCILYALWIGKIPVKQTLYYSVLINLLGILSTYLLRDSFTAIALSLGGGVLVYLSLLPLMGAAALFARRNRKEGMSFALMMSVFNLGQILSTLVGGWLFAIMPLKGLIFVSAAVSLSGLFYVKKISTL